MCALLDCFDDCEVCSADGSTCTSCYDGYYWDGSECSGIINYVEISINHMLMEFVLTKPENQKFNPQKKKHIHIQTNMCIYNYKYIFFITNRHYAIIENKYLLGF